MARRPGFEPDDPDSLAVAKLKATLKQSSPETRAHVLKWLAKFYNDSGDLFSPSISTQQRQRVTINETEYWLVGVPKR